MSTSDNNLLNFLQKQSLFNNSPTKNVNRKMSSRSREKRSEQLLQGGVNTIPNQPFTSGQNFNTNTTFTTGQSFNANQNFTPMVGQNFTGGQNFTQGQNFNSTQNGNFQANLQDNNTKVYYQNPNQFETNFQSQQQFGHVDFRAQTSLSPSKLNAQNTFQTANTNEFRQSGLNSGNNFTTSYNTYQTQIVRHPGSHLEPSAQNYLENVVTYAVDSTNYARTEAMKRLDILAERVRAQLNSLNSKLQGFNSQMMSIVVSQYNFVKSKVYQILEETFRESQKYCRGYISSIENQFNEDVLKARAALQRESENIALMKVDINKPHWESNAVFVSVEFQARVNKVIDQVKGLEVKSVQHQTSQNWQITLKRDLLDRVINRLQREREMAFGRN